MSRLVLISAWLLGTLPALGAGLDGFAAAAILAIQSEFPGVFADQVQLLGTPTPNGSFRGVVVRKARFDSVLRQWQVQLECVPNTACIPAVAVVRSSDRNLLSLKSALAFRSLKEIQVRSGDLRQVLTQVGSVRLRKSVICLQSGAAGERIRVRDLAANKVLLAEVQPDGSLVVRRAQ